VTPKGRSRLGYALIGVGFGMFMAGPLIVLAAGFSGIIVAVPPMLGFLVMAGGGVLLSLGGEERTRSASTTGAVLLQCPNCGAGAKALDADGFATCAYCGTRFVSISLSR